MKTKLPSAECWQKILTEENKNYEIDEAIDGLEGIEKDKKRRL
ncbi:hypothetical protein CCAN2_1670004 [Capnocytophaga canimorsus]|nr:hypothetical protein CCAN2_1670004 [Capnocytophaga canimorsus]